MPSISIDPIDPRRPVSTSSWASTVSGVSIGTSNCTGPLSFFGEGCSLSKPYEHPSICPHSCVTHKQSQTETLWQWHSKAPGGKLFNLKKKKKTNPLSIFFGVKEVVEVVLAKKRSNRIMKRIENIPEPWRFQWGKSGEIISVNERSSAPLEAWLLMVMKKQCWSSSGRTAFRTWSSSSWNGRNFTAN